MILTKEQRSFLIQELTSELHASVDGQRKNLIVPVCPFCGCTGGKFGIYIGQETGTKKSFMAHCFKCGATARNLDKLLDTIHRPDLKIEPTASFAPLEIPSFYRLNTQDEIDDELSVVEMPQGWKRCYRNSYLANRGFEPDDYTYFPVGTTRGLNFRYDPYVVFPIIDNGDTVGYISRHTWSKYRIDEHNEQAKRLGKYKILRYRNSTENDFAKLLYNYDAVIEDETETVILVEGVFDCIALVRKLGLYDNRQIAAVATFGKKISRAQIYKLQSKGVRNIVIAYDNDARDGKIKAAEAMADYFDCLILTLPSEGKDCDEASAEDIYNAFAHFLMTPCEYKLRTI